MSSLSPAAASPVRRWSFRRFAGAAFAVLLIFLVAIQLLPLGRDHTNPPVLAEPTWDRPETRALFVRACADCHSNQTIWPWYSNVAPLSWLVAHDVEEGRAALNISEWGARRQEADEAAETVQEGEMPLWFYVPLHPEANLSAAERRQLIAGLTATFGGEGEEHEGGRTDRDDDD